VLLLPFWEKGTNKLYEGPIECPLLRTNRHLRLKIGEEFKNQNYNFFVAKTIYQCTAIELKNNTVH